MKKLSEYDGQQHITAVLRAMIIRNKITNKISILGNDALAIEIIRSFWQSLNCSNTDRGDACGECRNCRSVEDEQPWSELLLDWHILNVDYQPARSMDDFIFYSFVPLDGFLSFQIKQGLGSYINSDLLALLIYSYQGTKQETLNAAKKISRQLSFVEFQQQYIDIFKNILYLKNNIDIVEIDKIEALRALSVRISVPDVIACIKLLWESGSYSALSDSTRIEVVSALISEALQPSVAIDYSENLSFTNEKPINVIEDTKLEQSLDINQMLSIAYE